MKPLVIVVRCAERIVPRVRYVFDTLFMALGVPVLYAAVPPADGAWLLYSAGNDEFPDRARCAAVAHHPAAWDFFEGSGDVESAAEVDRLAVVFPAIDPALCGPSAIPFDLVANAFYFLSSWSERRAASSSGSRRLHRSSVFARLAVPQDIVDRYLERLARAVARATAETPSALAGGSPWPKGVRFAIALSHDVDFLPSGLLGNLAQGGKSILRHLIRHRDPLDAIQAGSGLLRCLASGRDPYGCVPEIIAAERALGVRSSFQVAVGRRHPADVNYDIHNDRTRDYLRTILDAGFDLCLHGSYRSTEHRAWYVEEVELLGERLQRPLGSRQHFLSFDYDELFTAQEEAGIRYDMSMGFPDHCGPRAGFSYPYFPFDLRRNRPYDVLEISLFLMDVTLRGYLGLHPDAALPVIEGTLAELERKHGAASVVWHPIVFGGARDPGYAGLYWTLVQRVKALGGLATDARTIDGLWRRHATHYASFATFGRA